MKHEEILDMKDKKILNLEKDLDMERKKTLSLQQDLNLFLDYYSDIDDSTNFDSTTNNLFRPVSKEPYLIGDDLNSALINGSHSNSKSKREFVYMVVLNVIKNKGKDVIVYNYIEYNTIFFNLLYIYIILEQQDNFLFSKGGISNGLLFITNIKHEALLSEFSYGKYDDDWLVDNMILSRYPTTNTIDILKQKISNQLVVTDYNNMSNIINNVLSKDFCKVLNLLLKGCNPNRLYSTDNVHNSFTSKQVKLYNHLYRFIFIVSNLEHFIDNIKTNVDKDINQGPRSKRGKISLMNNVIINVDRGFRSSMINHNRHYLEFNPDLPQSVHIPKHRFSFNNIHCNLGNIKWYSTYS